MSLGYIVFMQVLGRISRYGSPTRSRVRTPLLSDSSRRGHTPVSQRASKPKPGHSQSFARRFLEVHELLLRISETEAFRASRVKVISRIRAICRRSEQVLFGEDYAVDSAADVVDQSAAIFPELFRTACTSMPTGFESAEISRLVWVRDSLTSYCVSLEEEDRRSRILTGSRRRGRSSGPERPRTATAPRRYFESSDFVPWYKLL